MGELTANVNWLAVIVGTVVAFLVGWLWYSPRLFGKQWAEGSGVDLGSASSMPVGAMVTQLLGAFCLAWVIGITATTDSLMMAILVIITVALVVASGGMFVRKSGAAVSVDAGYIVAIGVVMIICQGIF